MSDLEKYITSHKDEFNSFEPSSGHFQRFENRLNDQAEISPQGINRSMILKVAALILVMISVSVFVFDLATREIRERFAAGKSDTELPLEIRQAVQYYDNQANAGLGTLNKLAATRHEAIAVNESAMKEIQNLDDATADLKKLLADNPGNERILDAIVQNQQMKESVLNTIISQLSQKK
jgi:hypothetical protein